MEKDTQSEYVTVRPRFRNSAKWGAKVLALWVKPEGAARSKVLELSVTAEYVSDWTLTHALRELIANALDSGGRARVRHWGASDPRQTETQIENWDGATMALSHFLLGGGDYGAETIGQFHEGLKLALLVLCRERHPVTLKFGPRSCEITIKGLKLESVEEAKELFWALKPDRPPLLFEDSEGREIYRGDTGKGETFVQGLRQPIDEEETLYWTYNVPKELVPIARDRHIADVYALQNELAKAILGLKDEALMKEALEAILERDADGELAYFDLDPSKLYYRYSSWRYKGWKAHNEAYFKGKVLVDNANQAYVVRGLGKEPIQIAGSELSEWLCETGLQSFEDVAPEFWDLETSEIEASDPKLLAVTETIEALWPELDPDGFRYETFKEKFASDRRDGFMADQTVYVKESFWRTRDPEAILGLFIHELAHVRGSDLSVEFEAYLSDLLGQAAMAHFEANASEGAKAAFLEDRDAQVIQALDKVLKGKPRKAIPRPASEKGGSLGELFG